MGAIVPAGGAGQGDLWEELNVRNSWFHVLRAQIMDGTIREIGATAWAVYCVIKTYTNMQTGRSFPSQETIADLTGKSVDTVDRATKVLLARGMIERGREGRKSVYKVIESFPLERKSDGVRVGAAAHPYEPLGLESIMDQIKQYAKNGQMPPNATFQITLNVTNITQGDNSTVNLSIGAVEPGPMLRNGAGLSAEDVAVRQIARTQRLKDL